MKTILKAAGLALATLTLAACAAATNDKPAVVTPVTPVSNITASALPVGYSPAGTAQPAAAVGWTRYEAEDTAVAVTVLAGSSLDSNAFESGGKAVGGFPTAPLVSTVAADWSNLGCVKFTLTGLAAGTYTVRVGFNNDDAKTVLASNDGGNTIKPVALPVVVGSANEWNLAQTIDLNVPFSAGTNTFWISQPVLLKAGDPTPWINIDYIDLQKQ